MNNESFYPLTSKSLEKLYQANLTAAEWRLWTYLVVIDPWGDHYKDLPDTLTIMEKVGIKKSTFYAAIAKFQKFELFDFQDKGFAFRNLQGVPKVRNAVQDSGSFSEISENFPKSRKTFRKNGTLSKNLENQSPEPLPDKDSSSPQTLQTYKDFTDSLSDTERESFENFVKEEWRKLTSRNKEAGQEIISLERFLVCKEDFQNWYRKYLKSPVGQAAQKRNLASMYDWRNDPRFTEWIWQAFNRGYEWVEENITEREQRSAFHDWAFEVNAFEGVCYS